VVCAVNMRASRRISCFLRVASTAIAVLSAASTWQEAQAKKKPGEPILIGMNVQQAQGQEGQERLTITGVRLTQGDAVNCAQVRTDEGTVYSVSYLAPSIAIGDRVEVTGFMANITTCRGPVLYAEEVRHLGN